MRVSVLVLLCLLASSSSVAAQTDQRGAPTDATPPRRATTYRVQRGDELADIASQFGVSVQQLREWNELSGDNIRPGQRLRVSADAPGARTAADRSRRPQAVTHRVTSGETMTAIARRYGVTVAQIRQWNSLRSDTLRPGQRLTIMRGASRGGPELARIEPAPEVEAAIPGAASSSVVGHAASTDAAAAGASAAPQPTPYVATPEGAFAFRRGRWGLTEAEVEAAEPGRHEVAEGFWLYRVEVFDRPANLFYTFAGGHLVAATYFFNLGESSEIVPLFRDLKVVLGARYGEPETCTREFGAYVFSTEQMSCDWTGASSTVTMEGNYHDFHPVVEVRYYARNADELRHAAAVRFGARLFQGGGYRSFAWGTPKAEVRRVLGRPAYEAQEGLDNVLMYDQRQDWWAYSDVYLFDAEDRLVRGAIYVEEGSGTAYEFLRGAGASALGPSGGGAGTPWDPSAYRVLRATQEDGDVILSVSNPSQPEDASRSVGRHLSDF